MQEVTAHLTEQGFLVTPTDQPGQVHVWHEVGVGYVPIEDAPQEPAPPPIRPTNPNDIHGRLDWIESEMARVWGDIAFLGDTTSNLDGDVSVLRERVQLNHRAVKRMLSGVRSRIWRLEPKEKFPPLTHYPDLTLSGETTASNVMADEIAEQATPLMFKVDEEGVFNHVLFHDEIRQHMESQKP